MFQQTDVAMALQPEANHVLGILFQTDVLGAQHLENATALHSN